MKLGLAIRELHRSERRLARKLLRASDRHKTDHEMFHLCRDLARWSEDHVRELARVGSQWGVKLDGSVGESPALVSSIRQKGAELVGRRQAPGLLLLVDLREIYRMAAGVSLDWELLAQAAQAAMARDLFSLANRCHPETLRQARWANAKLKESSAQVLLA